jgi:hypothetical protein
MQQLPVNRNTKLGCLMAMRNQGFHPAVVLDVGAQTGTDALYRAFPTAGGRSRAANLDAASIRAGLVLAAGTRGQSVVPGDAPVPAARPWGLGIRDAARGGGVGQDGEQAATTSCQSTITSRSLTRSQV